MLSDYMNTGRIDEKVAPSVKHTKYAISLDKDGAKESVWKQILETDPKAKLDPEGNPTHMWVTTCLPLDKIEAIPGVEFVIEAKVMKEDKDENDGNPWYSSRGGDGWNKSEFEDLGLMDWFNDVEKVAYDIRNARRGSYCRDCGDTAEDLVNHLKNDILATLKDVIGAIQDRIGEAGEEMEDEDMDESVNKPVVIEKKEDEEKPGDEEHEGTEDIESIEDEKSDDDNRIKMMRDIVDSHQAKKIDGTMVDAMSANAIVTVYDQLSDENKKNFAKMPVAKMGDMAWKIITKKG